MSSAPQVVYIYGICSHEGQEDARAGFATDWGPNDSRNATGTAIGVKTELRAELTALKNVLETALRNSIGKLVVLHKSLELENELASWNESMAHEEHMFANEDLLTAIGKLKSEIQVKIDSTAEPTGFKNAMLLAKRIAGLHSTAAVPVTDKFWEEGTRIVDICGFEIGCGDDVNAGYGIFWGPGDKRNSKGRAFGRQNRYRAELTALRYALETAEDNGYDEIIIRSRLMDIHELINFGRKTGMMKNKDLLRGLIFHLQLFTSVRHFLPPRSMDVPEQVEAERLAREYCSMFKVSICGMGTTEKNGISTYGIYWTAGSERNESGWIAGAHGDLCAELTALERVLELSRNQSNLTVYTSSAHLKEFVHDWNLQDWPDVPGTQARCMEMFKTIRKMLESRVVKVLNSTIKDVQEARKMAESERASHVHTAGILHGDNNEPCGKYGVHWGPGDEKNECGPVPEAQSDARAKMWAVKRALEIALKNGIDKLIISTDYRSEMSEEKELRLEIRQLSQQMKYLKYEESQSNAAYLLAITSMT